MFIFILMIKSAIKSTNLTANQLNYAAAAADNAVLLLKTLICYLGFERSFENLEMHCCK